jgi:hypothetical protein
MRRPALLSVNIHSCSISVMAVRTRFAACAPYTGNVLDADPAGPSLALRPGSQ